MGEQAPGGEAVNGYEKAMQVFRKPPARPVKMEMPGADHRSIKFTRGDWKHAELHGWLRRLRAYVRHEMPDDPHSLHYVPRDLCDEPLPPVYMEVVQVPASTFESMLRKQAACDEALTLAVEALEFAHNRDMARLHVLNDLDKAEAELRKRRARKDGE